MAVKNDASTVVGHVPLTIISGLSFCVEVAQLCANSQVAALPLFLVWRMPFSESQFANAASVLSLDLEYATNDANGVM